MEKSSEDKKILHFSCEMTVLD